MDDSGSSKCLKASDLWSSDDDSDDGTDKIDDTTIPEEDWLSGNLDVLEDDSTNIVDQEEEITFVKMGNRRHLKVNGKKKLNMNSNDQELPAATCQIEINASRSREISGIDKSKKVRRYSEPHKISNNEELLQKRANRFGTPDSNMLKIRSERFGTPDLNIMKKRSEIFGTPDLNILKRRSERFGTPDLNIFEKRSERFETPNCNILKKRSLRLGTPDLNILKRKSDRFGIQPLEEIEASETIKKRQKRFGIVDGVELKTEYGKFSDSVESFNSKYKWTNSER